MSHNLITSIYFARGGPTSQLDGQATCQPANQATSRNLQSRCKAEDTFQSQRDVFVLSSKISHPRWYYEQWLLWSNFPDPWFHQMGSSWRRIGWARSQLPGWWRGVNLTQWQTETWIDWWAWLWCQCSAAFITRFSCTFWKNNWCEPIICLCGRPKCKWRSKTLPGP